MNEAEKNFLSGMAMIILAVLLCLTIKSCSHQESIEQVDRNSKCFEQTHDKSCWGIK